MGVLVVLNDEIQAAREVTKTATLRLQTFRSADFGVLGHADGDAVAFYRRPLRRCCPDTEFDIRTLDALPRVDIAYAYAGGDGTAVRAFVAAGAQGHRLGRLRAGLRAAGRLRGAEGGGGARRRGRAMHARRQRAARSAARGSRDAGFLIADNLNPQKARILLALALTVTHDPEQIARNVPDLLRRPTNDPPRVDFRARSEACCRCARRADERSRLSVSRRRRRLRSWR